MLVLAIVIAMLVFVIAYAFWFRQLVLDFPIALRLALSALPAYVLYRVVPMIQVPRWTAHRGMRFYTVGFFPWIAAAFFAIVLYHLWRDILSQRRT